MHSSLLGYRPAFSALARGAAKGQARGAPGGQRADHRRAPLVSLLTKCAPSCGVIPYAPIAQSFRRSARALLSPPAREAPAPPSTRSATRSGSFTTGRRGQAVRRL